MHPTPEEQLQAVLRHLDAVAADSSLSESAREALDDARRLVRRLERTWAGRLPFLLTDNRLAAELLSDLSPMLPELVAEIDAATRGLPASDGHDIDEPSAHLLNKWLQDLLGRAVHLLPDHEGGDAGRSRIARHARERLAADPTLNREPTDRRPPEEPTQ